MPKFVLNRHVPTRLPAPGEDFWQAREPWANEKEALLEEIMRPRGPDLT
jgi:hypothetical protein